jgi:hypothetical protein
MFPVERMFGRRSHLSQEDIALYVDAIKLDRSDQMQKELRSHVADCEHCKMEITELCSLLEEQEYSREELHPYFDARRSRRSSVAKSSRFVSPSHCNTAFLDSQGPESRTKKRTPDSMCWIRGLFEYDGDQADISCSLRITPLPEMSGNSHPGLVAGGTVDGRDLGADQSQVHGELAAVVNAVVQHHPEHVRAAHFCHLLRTDRGGDF